MIQIWEYYKYGESRYNSKVEDIENKAKVEVREYRKLLKCCFEVLKS